MATFVLIPGAGGDAWYWHRVVPLLEQAGHVAIAVTLPAEDESAGWAEYADAIVETTSERSEIVLVAQSLAGFSAPLACERIPIEALVLVNAMIPIPGETGGAWWSNSGQGAAQAEYLRSIGLSPEAARDERVLYFHDVPSDVIEDAYRRGEPGQSDTPMSQPWPLRAWPDIPTLVVTGRDDRLFPAAFQRRIARDRLGLEPTEIDGGHLVALSHPRELVDVLLTYRRDAHRPSVKAGG